MARRFDLGMSLNYVSEWGIVQAVRELFQNARDAQVVNPDNKMFFDYDKDTQTLRVGNRNGSLTTDTLLLGVSTKRGDSHLIGQHGEGYKVATVVFLRNNKTLKVYNRKSKEVWTAKIVKSRRYGTDVAVFDIEKVSLFKSVPDHDLIFEVGNITPEEYERIVDSILYLQDGINKIAGYKGEILLDEKFKGKIYVSGLYVTTKSILSYGYNLDSEVVALDRDRALVDGYDLQFTLAKLIYGVADKSLILELKDSWEGQYMSLYTNRIQASDVMHEVCDDIYADFLTEHGADAVPVSTTQSFNRYNSLGLKPVLVSDNDYYFMRSSANYKEPEETLRSKADIINDLKDWYDSLDETAKKSGESIINEVISLLDS